MTIVIIVDSGAGTAGAAPKPVSLEADGPIAQAASGKTIETTRRLIERMFVILFLGCGYSVSAKNLPTKRIAEADSFSYRLGPQFLGFDSLVLHH
ncbi:hypothetical protein PQR02_02650 [Paraburkholderia sediminicola]|uniref:Uncharacterized protein n=1 Tax=Paraburkholderia rhynchosiae TaxID=487049 RepID=A0ACC7N570_9BURK